MDVPFLTIIEPRDAIRIARLWLSMMGVGGFDPVGEPVRGRLVGDLFLAGASARREGGNHDAEPQALIHQCLSY